MPKRRVSKSAKKAAAKAARKSEKLKSKSSTKQVAQKHGKSTSTTGTQSMRNSKRTALSGKRTGGLTGNLRLVPVIFVKEVIEVEENLESTDASGLYKGMRVQEESKKREESEDSNESGEELLDTQIFNESLDRDMFSYLEKEMELSSSEDEEPEDEGAEAEQRSELNAKPLGLGAMRSPVQSFDKAPGMSSEIPDDALDSMVLDNSASTDLPLFAMEANNTHEDEIKTKEEIRSNISFLVDQEILNADANTNNTAQDTSQRHFDERSVSSVDVDYETFNENSKFKTNEFQKQDNDQSMELTGISDQSDSDSDDSNPISKRFRHDASDSEASGSEASDSEASGSEASGSETESYISLDDTLEFTPQITLDADDLSDDSIIQDYRDNMSDLDDDEIFTLASRNIHQHEDYDVFDKHNEYDDYFDRLLAGETTLSSNGVYGSSNGTASYHKKQKRRERHLQHALGFHNLPPLWTKYPDNMSVLDIYNELAKFATNPERQNNLLSFPPLGSNAISGISSFASHFNLKSKTCGSKQLKNVIVSINKKSNIRALSGKLCGFLNTKRVFYRKDFKAKYIPDMAALGLEGGADFPAKGQKPKNSGRIRDGQIVGHNATEIDPNNFGHRLMKLMGWTEGSGLGKERAGIVAPISATVKLSKIGLGG